MRAFILWLGASMSSNAVFVPVLEARLRALLNAQGVVQWRFDATIAVRMLGRERAENTWNLLVAGPYWHIKDVLWLLTVCALSALLALGSLFLIPAGLMVAAAILLFVLTVIAIVFFIDMRIARYVLTTGVFWANLILASIGIISVTFLWTFDYRTCVFPVYVNIVAFTALVDALPPSFRLYIGIPGISALCLMLVLVIVVINFSRFPGQLSTPAWNLGDFWGLSEQPLIIS
jgi:hypothetical protein